MARGEAIAKIEGAITRIDQNEYRVRSQSGAGEYRVVSGELGWLCSCPDASFRKLTCKHIWSVQLSLRLRERVVEQKVIQPIEVSNCPRCRSEKIKRSGLRRNQSGDIQRYACKSCGYWFATNLGFERMKATPQTVTMAMQLYFSGLSFASTSKALKLRGVKISSVGVYKWVRKYVRLMESYLDQIQPKVSDTWRADELWVKIKGDMKYVFALMDDETRFWIAQEVADTKKKHNPTRMFREGMRLANKVPETLITDGLPSYHKAWNKVYNQRMWSDMTPRHIKEIALDGEIHNNKMERMNGETRDREKVIRGLKRTDTPILKGYQIYHNFFRPHMGLKGRTPAEAAGIKIEGENPWVTVIQNAAKSKLPTVNESGEMPTS
jgi:transposase-like protein/predicted RNA-binding Zn-ribbon protein involved in translation (DUF1610 family)